MGVAIVGGRRVSGRVALPCGDIARMLLRGQLGTPSKGENGAHRYERLVARDALERDFPNVAANASLRTALSSAAAQAVLRLQVIESGVSR